MKLKTIHVIIIIGIMVSGLIVIDNCKPFPSEVTIDISDTVKTMTKKRWLTNGNEYERSQLHNEGGYIVIGRSKPTKWYSEDELVKMDVRGIYAVGGLLNKSINPFDKVISDLNTNTR